MADSMPSAERPSVEGIPARIRVHALAKLLGMTSKQAIAELAALGVTVTNPQSGVDRADAVRMVEALHPVVAEEPEATAVAEPAESSAPPVPAAYDPFAVPVDFAKPVEPIEESLPDVAPPPEAAPVAPLFLQPDPTAVVEETGGGDPGVPDDAEPGESEEPGGGEGAREAADDGDDAEETGRPRRRRGRRGRGRGRGESGDDREGGAPASRDERVPGADTDAAPGDATTGSDDRSGDAESDEADDPGDGTETTSASSRRRRRRRRRTGEPATTDTDTDTDAGSDDEVVLVREREPRRRPSSSDDEVRGISGSTRLEARRQRRRDGRDASRRRPPILSESEFLARREAVDRVMVVREKERSDHPGVTTQVAVLEDGVLVEHFVTSDTSASMVGNVYVGRVQNVLPSMEAAFIDIGRGRNGVLYAGEVNWDAVGLGGRARKIEQALKPGDQVVVQVSKDPVGHKGARLTAQVSLAGRFLVFVPDGTSAGISRKLPDTERRRLKAILKDIVPADSGVIIRTASEGVSEEEITRDLERLRGQWDSVKEAAEKAEKSGSGAPRILYEEPDMLVKVVRDLFNEDFSTLVVEGGRAWETIEKYVSAVAPELMDRVSRFEASGAGDVFAVHRVDEQLAKAMDRKVWLPSGGSLVIDRTEAMTVVDVNTGKFTGSGGNLEETVTKNNLEAAEEIVRQMRLRDIGGMIVVDFIDMVLESNRDLVLRRLTEALGRDRTRHQVSEVTSLGLVQMTRKKLGTGLIEAFSTNCECCGGRGIVIHTDPVESKTDGSNAAQESGGRRRRRGGQGGGAPENGDAQRGGNGGPTPAAHPVALAMAAGTPEKDDADHPGEETAVDPVARGADDESPESADTDRGEEQADGGDDGRGRRRSRGRRRRGRGRGDSEETRDAEDSVVRGDVAVDVVAAIAVSAADAAAAAEPEEFFNPYERPADTAEADDAAEAEATERAGVVEPAGPAPDVAAPSERAPRRRRRAVRATLSPTPEADSAAEEAVEKPAGVDKVAPATLAAPTAPSERTARRARRRVTRTVDGSRD